MPEWDELTRLNAEKATLGFYFSGHPLTAYQKELQRLSIKPINQLIRYCDQSVTIAGVQTHLRTLQTKSGKRMAIIQLEDNTDTIEITLFSEQFEQSRVLLNQDDVLVITGQVEKDNFTHGIRMRAESLQKLEDLRSMRIKRLLIQVEDQQQADELLTQLPVILQDYKGGRCQIALVYQSRHASAELILGSQWQVYPTNQLLAVLRKKWGETSVKLAY